MSWPVLAAAISIFAAAYALIFFGHLHRTVGALVGAVAMVVAGTALGFFRPEAVVAAMDADTLWLLFGMMVLVGLLRETGFFQYIAIRAAKIARGNPTVLFISFGVCTAGASMFLDNATTLLTVVPVTVSVAEVLGLPVAPLLMMEAMMANIGGMATLVGDRPNVLIASAADLSFKSFLLRTLPVALVTFGVAMAFLAVRFRRTAAPNAQRLEALMAMDERRVLSQPQAMWKLLAVLGVVFALFGAHHVLGLTPAVIALIGAALSALVLRPNVETFLRGVEWDHLLFLAALLVITGGLEASGALGAMGRWALDLAGGSKVLLGLIVLWVGAILSWGLSSIPATVTLIAVIRGLGGTGVPLTPLWWALALGVGLGANGTPFGSLSNIVVLSIAEHTRQPLSARAWLRDGIPIALFSCLVASGFLWLGIATGWFL